jgi:hypothetical protein
MLTVGLGKTLSVGVGNEAHPVDVSVKVNVTGPTAMAVTNPELLTVATELLLLDHVPPVDGVN